LARAIVKAEANSGAASAQRPRLPRAVARWKPQLGHPQRHPGPLAPDRLGLGRVGQGLVEAAEALQHVAQVVERARLVDRVGTEGLSVAGQRLGQRGHRQLAALGAGVGVAQLGVDVDRQHRPGRRRARLGQRVAGREQALDALGHARRLVEDLGLGQPQAGAQIDRVAGALDGRGRGRHQRQAVVGAAPPEADREDQPRPGRGLEAGGPGAGRELDEPPQRRLGLFIGREVELDLGLLGQRHGLGAGMTKRARGLDRASGAAAQAVQSPGGALGGDPPDLGEHALELRASRRRDDLLVELAARPGGAGRDRRQLDEGREGSVQGLAVAGLGDHAERLAERVLALAQAAHPRVEHRVGLLVAHPGGGAHLAVERAPAVEVAVAEARDHRQPRLGAGGIELAEPRGHRGGARRRPHLRDLGRRWPTGRRRIAGRRRDRHRDRRADAGRGGQPRQAPSSA
jgi:hypothetical protein